ncbi:MAG: toxin-antitoxin system TumE family protein [Candidatus Saccharimonadales bacterium]
MITGPAAQASRQSSGEGGRLQPGLLRAGDVRLLPMLMIIIGMNSASMPRRCCVSWREWSPTRRGAPHTLPLDPRQVVVHTICPHEMNDQPPDHGLEFLLAFDGRIHHLEEGYRLKFEIKRVATAEARPHGLSYSFTLHAPDGTRLVGYDNAHSVPPGVPGSDRRPLATHRE